MHRLERSYGKRTFDVWLKSKDEDDLRPTIDEPDD